MQSILSKVNFTRVSSKRNNSAECVDEVVSKQIHIDNKSTPSIRKKYSYKVGDTLQLASCSLYGFYDNNFVLNDETIAIDNDYVLYLEWKNNQVNGTVIVANIQQKKYTGIYKVENNIILACGDTSLIHHDILSNVYTGERWEGDCIDEAPCGWGDFYNSDNVEIYSGFRYGDKNICYGTYFYPDILNGKIQFNGFHSNGNLYGYGRRYDKNERLIGEGSWINGHYITFQDIEITPTSVTTGNTLMNSLVFKDRSGPYLHSLQFAHLPELTQFIVGDYCMLSLGCGEDLSLCFKNSPKLKVIRIGYSSFAFYSRFLLQSIL